MNAFSKGADRFIRLALRLIQLLTIIIGTRWLLTEYPKRRQTINELTGKIAHLERELGLMQTQQRIHSSEVPLEVQPNIELEAKVAQLERAMKVIYENQRVLKNRIQQQPERSSRNPDDNTLTTS